MHFASNRIDSGDGNESAWSWSETTVLILDESSVVVERGVPDFSNEGDICTSLSRRSKSLAVVMLMVRVHGIERGKDERNEKMRVVLLGWSWKNTFELILDILRRSR